LTRRKPKGGKWLPFRRLSSQKQIMFDPALIPPGIWPPSKVRELNEMLARLEARKVDRIVMPEPGSGFRASNVIRTYCQAYLRRCLVLINSAYDLFFIENGLVSMMCLRSIYETVAAFLDFEKKLQTLIVRGDLQAIFDFAKQRTHFAKVEHLVAEHGDQIKATNILTQVEKMAHGGIRFPFRTHPPEQLRRGTVFRRPED
jgi:hypothetical protein